KTSLGLDCSGLLQVALGACGVACPRDSPVQEQALGRALSPSIELAKLRRGGLVFWERHAGIVRDVGLLLFAQFLPTEGWVVALAPASALRAAPRTGGS